MAIEKQKGTSLLELVIVIALITTVFAYLLVIINFSLKRSYEQANADQASFLAQEMIEATKSIRANTDWPTTGLGTMTSGISYHLSNSGGVWQLIGGEKIEDGFTEKIVFSNVYRDINGNIVDIGGVFDSDTKKVTATVSWTKSGKSFETEIISLFTNWQ